MDLGQIFTTGNVASYMVNLFTIPKDARIIEPCFGEGAFLRALTDSGYSEVDGYEIDRKLFDNVKNKYTKYNLVNADFLSCSTEQLYDGIIMNPPYIRHEKINDLKELGVSKEKLSENDLFNSLPHTANMYMYFIVKGFSLLRMGGEMIVIFPSSWINTRSGDSFQKMIKECAGIKRRIHISGEVFEKNALVEVLILKLVKGDLNTNYKTEYVHLSNDEFIKLDAPEQSDMVSWKTSFSKLANVRRGLTTGYNEMYINPNLNNKKYMRPIISSPKNICGFSTKDARKDWLFAPLDENLDKKCIEYLKYWKKIILENKKPQTLLNKIATTKTWYRLNLFDCEGIIFSYFVRNDMKFVMNEEQCIIRDNFYIIYPKIDKWILFSLLNNYYTYYQLESMGKKYGAGLLKLQRYDIESITFPDIDAVKENDMHLLKKYGSQLAQNGNRKCIDDITKILSVYSEYDFNMIKQKYETKRKKRLEGL